MRNEEKILKASTTFMQDVYNIHGDNLLVLDSYVRSKVKVNVLCNTCGNVWGNTPDNLKKGKGCPICASKAVGDIRRQKAAANFLGDIHRIHEGRIIITGPYVDDKTKVPFTCNVCGNEHTAAPTHLKQGHGCKVCYNFTNRRALERPTKIYCMYLPEHELWKIGCTVETIHRRFRQEGSRVLELVHYEVLPTGIDAYKLEGYLLRKFREFKYRGPRVLKSGNTELLTKCIDFKEALEQAKLELGITNGN
jgi:hypothetical protein